MVVKIFTAARLLVEILIGFFLLKVPEIRELDPSHPDTVLFCFVLKK